MAKDKFGYGDNREKSSIVARAVFGLSDGHDLREATDYDRRIYDILAEAPLATECVLQSSSEEHWVSHFAAYILEHQKKNSPSIGFHTFFEIPSKRSEKHEAAGYDLSIGPYDSDFRLRTMHKTTKRSWCDEKWTVPFKKEDIKHLKDMARNQSHPLFIVVHSFYCIHDWRRMGQTATPNDGNKLDGQIRIPSIESLFRTVIFDLDDVREFLENTPITKFRILRAKTKATGNTDAVRMASLEKPDLYGLEANKKIVTVDNIPLRPITIADFLSRVDESWADQWSDSMFAAH